MLTLMTGSLQREENKLLEQLHLPAGSGKAWKRRTFNLKKKCLIVKRIYSMQIPYFTLFLEGLVLEVSTTNILLLAVIFSIGISSNSNGESATSAFSLDSPLSSSIVLSLSASSESLCVTSGRRWSVWGVCGLTGEEEGSISAVSSGSIRVIRNVLHSP